MSRKSAAFTTVELRTMLSGGDRRSIGRSNQLAGLLNQDVCPSRWAVDLLFDTDPLIRIRAADALEKASARDPRLLAPFRQELVSLLCEARQQELRWHLALMAPRLNLPAPERARVVTALKSYLDDRSSIVKTCALQALAQLAAANSRLEEEVHDLLRKAAQNGTPAMQARARKLLKGRNEQGRARENRFRQNIFRDIT